MSDNSPFWKLPRRPPTPIDFDPTKRLHLDFVKAYARLYAEALGQPEEARSDSELVALLLANEGKVPGWQPKNKHIETDETKRKEDVVKETATNDLSNLECAQIIGQFVQKVVYIFSRHAFLFQA